MAYRNGTYIAFHANGTNRPGESDIDYYNLLRAWSAHPDDDFSMINSHEKAYAVKDSSKRATLRASLLERLRNSRNMMLIIGQTTRFDIDWVPFEIQHAVDSYRLPIIAVYPDYDRIMNPGQLRPLWPSAFQQRIDNGTIRAIHIPFKKLPILDAVSQFHLKNPPTSALDFYRQSAYAQWGLW